MSDKKKIILAMIEAGGGHKSPAVATHEGLEKKYSGQYDISIPDFTLEVGAYKLDAKHKRSWKNMLSQPTLTTMGYVLQDNFSSLSRWIAKNWIKEFITKGGQWLRQNTPDIFVSFHFFNTIVALEARKKYRLNFPIITYLTEPLDAHAMWVWKDMDYMVVSSEQAQQKLIQRHFPFYKIKKVPYLIRPTFFEFSRSREEIQNELGIDPSMKTVLISAGGEGLGKLRPYTLSVLKKGLPVNFIAVCGRNEELKAELDTLKAEYTGETNLIPLGFMTNMNELIYASDIIAGKASPGTTYEALYLDKVIIHTEFSALHEKRNTNFILENGLGIFTQTKKKFTSALTEFLEHPETLEKYQANIKNMHFTHGAVEMADFIVDVMNDFSY